MELARLDQWRDGQVVVVVDSLVFDRGSHLEGGVASLPDVEDLEVFEDGGSGLVSVGEAVPVEEFGFEGGEERLGNGVDAPIVK